MKLLDLIDRLHLLEAINGDADVQDRFGDDISQLKVVIEDGRRYVRLLTDADNYRQQLNDAEQKLDDARATLDDLTEGLTKAGQTLNELARMV